MPDSRKLLLTRNKGQRITYEQKKIIYELIKEDVPIRIIKDKYSLSESTMKRIFRMFEEGGQRLKRWSSELGINIFKSSRVKNEAIDFIFNQEVPFTSKDVCISLKEKLNVDIDRRTITKFMKNELSMSFKKASSRPIQIDVKIIQRLKALFSIMLTKQLDKIEWVVNLDESSFSRLTKQNYTWLLKGVPGSVKNIQFSWSINLITAISTTGASYSSMANKTTDSDWFIAFFHKLFKEIEIKEGIDRRMVLLILDNAPCHQSNKVTGYLEVKHIKHIFLPQYSPDLAPVELFFGRVKQLVKGCRKRSTNLNKSEGVDLIALQIKLITRDCIKRIWTHFYRRLWFYLKEKGSMSGIT